MLVSAFAGYKNTMNAYQQAVAEQYRFSATAMRCSSAVTRRRKTSPSAVNFPGCAHGAALFQRHQTVSLMLEAL